MNLINLLFIQLTIVIVIFGSLMNLVEKYLPTSIKQMFRYGKHSYKGEKSDKLIEKIEIPKAWFKHFYVFALCWSWLGLLLAISVYFYGYRPHRFLISYFDLSCGSDRQIETSPVITLTALFLITLQCTRRFVETNFLQIFSRKSKINLTHYLCGYLHYYGVVVLILAKSDGFKADQDIPKFSYELKDIVLIALVMSIYMYLWYKQFETNMIFIRLRTTKAGGKIATESHLMPEGGWFKYISSPHMTTEVGMYSILYALLFPNTSYIYCLFWVISNQICNAILTHKWYLETFKNYPKERKAIIPFIL